MLISDITVEVRDDTFNRIGQILPKDLVGFKAVLRFNNVGSWEITLPAGHEVGEILRLPGSGIIVTGPSGVILSGPTMSATNSKTRENPNGEWIITGVDDSVILGERLAYPDPTNADVSTQSQAFDARPTLASTAMIGYVSDNIGPTGALQRKISNLSVGADLSLGSTVYPAARFDILGELLSGIASIDGLGFDVKQTDGILEFQVYQPVDRSGYIRMDVANNTLSSTQYAYGSHSLSRAIVAGQGEGSNRQFIEVTSTESLSAETLWGRRIETFIDQRNTADADELAQAGQEKLADGGATLTSVDVTPSSDLTMAYGQDWGLGDKVTVVVDEQEVQAIVTTVSMSIESDGIRVGATVGEPTGVDYESKMAKRSTNTAQRVNALERKEGSGLATEHGITAKNITTSTIPRGTVVMFAGAHGDTVSVAPAVADGTYPEIYLVGITHTDILADDFGLVLQLGFIDHINTSPFSVGDILYASSTTPGALSLTPGAWDTPIAAVTRDHAETGRILVRAIPVDIPPVDISDTSPANPHPNDLWWDSTDGTLYVRYKDPDGTIQWVEASVGGEDSSAVNAFNTRLGAVESQLVPAGVIMQWAGATAPTGYFLCDGTAKSRSAYSGLFAAIGTSYGAGDGSTTFNVPNLQGKIPVGLDSSQAEFNTLGKTGGAKTHTLSIAEMPSHTHVQDSHNHTQNAHNHTITSVYDDANYNTGNIPGNNQQSIPYDAGSITRTQTVNSTTATNIATTATNQNTGGGGAHNNLQPYIVTNYIIKA